MIEESMLGQARTETRTSDKTEVIVVLGQNPFGRQQKIAWHEVVNLKYKPSLCQIKSLEPSCVFLNLEGGLAEDERNYLLALAGQIHDEYQGSLNVYCQCKKTQAASLQNLQFNRIFDASTPKSSLASELEKELFSGARHRQIYAQLKDLQLFKRKIDREAEQASLFQGALFNQAGQSANLESAFHYAFSREIGRDFFRLFDLAPSHAGVLMGRVGVKGSIAALLIGFLLGEIHSIKTDNPRLLWQPAELMSRLSDALYHHNHMTELQAAVWYGVIDLTQGQITFSNANHLHPLFAGPEMAECQTLTTSSRGFQIGAFPGMVFDQHKQALPQGAQLLFYSEGLLNASASQHTDELSWLKETFDQARGQAHSVKDLPALIDCAFTEATRERSGDEDRLILACAIPQANQFQLHFFPADHSSQEAKTAFQKIPHSDNALVLDLITGSLPAELDSDFMADLEFALALALDKSLGLIKRARLMTLTFEEENDGDKPSSRPCGLLLSWWVHADRIDLSLRLDSGALPWSFSPQEGILDHGEELLALFDRVEVNIDGSELSLSKSLPRL